METGTEASKIVFRPFADAQRPPRSKDDKPDSALCAGMPLPIHLRHSFPKNLIGKPIDDFDPFYQNEKTFVVVGGHWIIYRFDAEKSLFMMSAASRVRQVAITMATNSFAHYFMFLVIFLYALAHMQGFSQFLILTRLGFLFIFCVEVVVKVIAYGFLLKKFAYLRDPWNWLDFLATFLQFPSFLGVGFFAPMRIIRLVNFFTKSRLLFANSCNVLLKMRDVVIYAVFSVFFWSITFLNLYSGVLSSTCVKDKPTNDSSSSIDHTSHDSENVLFDHAHLYDEHRLCGNSTGSLHCPDGYTCLIHTGPNPNYGYTNFDNFYWSAVSIVRLMTRDYWENLFTQLHSTTGPYCLIMLLIVIILGSYVIKIFVAAHMFLNHGQMLDILTGRKKTKRSIEDTEKEKSRVDDKDTTLVDVPFVDDVTTHFKRESSVTKEEPELVILSNSKPSEKVEEIVVIKDSVNPLDDCCSTFLDFACAWQCCACCIKMQEFFSKIVFHRYFEFFICVTIVVNTFFMAMDHHHMSITLAVFLFWVNCGVFLIYFFEAILKILAMSPRQYFRNSWCKFEFAIVFFTFLEFGLESVSGLSILRALRLLRVLRIGKFYRHFNSLLTVGFSRFYVFFVFVLSFAILGEYMFGSNYAENVHFFPNHELPRFNFLDFMHSSMVVTRILCGAWVETFWDCSLVSGYGCVPFYFVAVILGNLLVMNVFISYVMIAFERNNLCETESEVAQQETITSPSLFTTIGEFVCRLCAFDRCCPKGADKLPSAKSEEHLFEVSLEGEVKPITVNRDEVADACCPIVWYSWFPFCGSPSTSPTMTTQTSFWNTWQLFRNKLLAIMKHNTFRNAFAIFVFITCLVPLVRTESRQDEIRVMNWIVLVGFSLEMLMKFCAVGCRTCFSIGWNRFDFVVTTLHLFSCLFGSSLGNIGSYFYAMRILKLFSYNRRLPVLVEAIFYRFSYITNAIFASFIIWILFAMIGVQLFAGRFFWCEDAERTRIDFPIVTTLNECTSLNLTWTTAEINFDHIGNAFIALMQVATMNGEIMIMWNAIDSRGINVQPSREANLFMSFYFTCFMYLGVLCCYSFVFMSFVKKINVQKHVEGGYIETLMTSIQRANYRNRKKTLFKRPLKTIPEPTLAIRKPVHRLVSSQKFTLAISLVLVFTALAMVIDHRFTSDRMSRALRYIHFVFTVVFIAELILKLIAYGRSFFSFSWNVYDFCVIVYRMPVGVVFEEYMAKYFISPSLFLLLIVLRLIRRIKCLRRVLVSVQVLLPVVFNVALLLFVVAFFYAVAGVALFHDHLFESGLDELHNFKSIGAAFSIMVKMMFGGGWDMIYSGLIGYPYYCDEAAGHCISSFHVHVFILSFIAICFLILFQAGTVLLLEYYECLVRKRHLGITDQDLEDFSAVWRIFDPYGCGSIPYDLFSDLLATLAAPFKKEQPNHEMIVALDVPVSKDNRVEYDDVLQALLRHLDTDRAFYGAGRRDHSDECDTLKQQREEDSARKIQKWWKNREDADNRVEDK